MNKKITLILQDTHNTIYQKEKIVQVSRGYAFNYLIPKKIAKIATPGRLKHLKMIEAKQKKQFQIKEEKAYIVLKYIEKINKINIRKKYSNTKQIFGKISEKEILNKIFIYTSYTFNKKEINMPDVKHIGTYSIKIKPFDRAETNFSLNIIPETTKINI